MDCWKEDSEQCEMDATTGRDDNIGTCIIALGRVEEEAEESTLVHSYARVERQAGEVLLGGMTGSNRNFCLTEGTFTLLF
jgi:hypothetical protein